MLFQNIYHIESTVAMCSVAYTQFAVKTAGKERWTSSTYFFRWRDDVTRGEDVISPASFC